ncbi:MAG: flagellar protein FliS [Planctomycetes bacterium]|nr:flagellar protein FliS [Planctomycetota bacterium]
MDPAEEPERDPARPDPRRIADLYLRTMVLTAEPVRLVLSLYESAIALLDRALESLRVREDPGPHISKAIQILAELDLFLDFERAPELSAALADIYEHLQSILAGECANPTRAGILEVGNDLRILHEAWGEVRRRAHGDA